MQSKAFYPHEVTSVHVEETHISMVFLTGTKVYKLKKPVKMGFLDFSSLSGRKFFCHEEVRLNRRLSRGVYEGVAAITAEGDEYRLNGPGPPVEYAVQMVQLPRDRTMKYLLRRGGIAGDDLTLLARLLVEFYQNADTGGDVDDKGRLLVIERNCEDNFTQTADAVGSLIDPGIYEMVKMETRRFLREHRPWFDHRIETHRIRDGHGDLRAGHIYFTSDGIQIIDCIEFNDQFRCVDMICDLAFLVMDLDFLGFAPAGKSLVEAYFRRSNDLGAFTLLSFYKCYRAMVRVKVNCLRLLQSGLDGNEHKTLYNQTERFMALACGYAENFSRPAIWVVCGMIASGKSTIAEALARALRIDAFNSDRIRKHLAGGGGPSPYGQGIYTEEMTGLTYGKLLYSAQMALEKGESVVLDATFGRRENRDAVQRLADHCHARVFFIECHCEDKIIRERLEHRGQGGSSLSDARLEHLPSIQANFQEIKEVPSDRKIRVDTANSPDSVLCSILAQFG